MEWGQLAQLAARVRGAESFEDAAIPSLTALMDVVAATTEQAKLSATVTRAMVHLRPSSGFAGLFVLDRGAEKLHAPGPAEALLPSVSAWRVLERTEEAVAVDVNFRLLTPRGQAPQAARWGEDGELSERTKARLLKRDATHLYALPLHTPEGLFGMVSIEVTCPGAIGSPFVWDACSDALETIVTLAGPYLEALPVDAVSAGVTTAHEHELLPVVGPTMRGLVDVMRAFAQEEETLLIKGETGTGKSRIARWCHAQSERADGPFELLDLLSVPDETQAGELFGWKRGAFTGAVKDHDGHVTRAEGGTLFIDEIDKLSSKAQAALLYLLEERHYRVLGDDGPPRRADVRFIVGTNVDLMTAVREGRFREDLFYRINVLPTMLPALRERADEVADWARFMLRRRHAEKGKTGAVTLEDEAAQLLRAQPWPGNLRQLDNVVRRAHTLALAGRKDDARVTAAHVTTALGMDGTPMTAVPVAASTPTRRLGELTEEEVLEALARTGFRRAKAAEALGISRSSLYGFLAQSKLIPKPSELTRDQIVEARDAHAGDLHATAQALRVSVHGLKLRLRELALV